MKGFTLAFTCLWLASAPAAAQTATSAPAAEKAWPEAWFEIFKLVPGKQEDFIRRLDQTDQVRAAGGLPPVQLFFHDNGADFDPILFKPVALSSCMWIERLEKWRATNLPRAKFRYSSSLTQAIGRPVTNDQS